MATLIVHTQGTLVEARAKHLRLVTPDGMRTELPLVGIERMHVFGKVQITTQALTVLSESGKEVAWFSRGGRLRARLAINPSGAGIAVRRAQYRQADNPEYVLGFAQRLIAAKIANQRAVLMRGWRTRTDLQDQNLLERLAATAEQLDVATDLDAIRGHEGASAAAYWPAWAAFCSGVFQWNGRNRRPPRDPLNALLSFLYAMLALEVQAQCEAIGLDPWLGFLHAERPGHAALASDLMEPFRPVLVDRLILDLVGHNRIGIGHFEWAKPYVSRDPDRLDDVETEAEASVTDAPPVPRLTDEGRKTVLTAWERRMAHEDTDEGLVKGGRAMIGDNVALYAKSLTESNPDRYVPIRLRT